MKVVDLPVPDEKIYFHCLEDWSEEIKEAGDHKEQWFRRMEGHGLRVKLVKDDAGTVGGMIQYGPIENVPVEGRDLYYVYCIWVHGYAKGRGNFQKRGMGKALLQAAEDDVRGLGGKGLVVWGLSLPFFMKASWYRKNGYRRVDRDGIQELLWKPFVPDAVAPRMIKQRMKPPLEPRKVVVTGIKSGWCPAQNLAYERARRAASLFGDKVVFRPVDAFDRETAVAWGVSDALYIDGTVVRTGPPPSFDKIKKAIAKKIRQLR